MAKLPQRLRERRIYAASSAQAFSVFPGPTTGTRCGRYVLLRVFLRGRFGFGFGLRFGFRVGSLRVGCCLMAVD